jgi:3-hydroxyanthranilate 3,4-dioxygenase
MIRRPFNLTKWIEENRHLLQPPVSNKNLYVESGDYIVMIVGGPNARKDYHYNETEELFYQIEGDIVVGIQEEGKAVDVEIKAGEMFLLPAHVPHQPRRGANTVGLVIEVKRADREFKDGLMWFCEQCNHPLWESKFVLKDIERDFISRFKEFYGSTELRTCKSCGHVMETDPRFTDDSHMK